MPRIAIIAIRTWTRLDQARVAREQRLDEERLVGLDDEVDPRAGDVDARQVARIVDDLVDLRDHDAVAERGGLDERRRVFGARPGVEVALRGRPCSRRPARRSASGRR